MLQSALGSAKDWATAVSKVVGGKAGGKEPTMIGVGTESTKVDDAVEAARRHIESLTL